MAIQSNNRLKANLKLRLFLSFFALSVIFWLLINLSKTYTSQIELDVSYTALPNEKVMQETPLEVLNATVTTTGFNLIRYKISNRKVQVNLNKIAYKSGTFYYILPNAQKFDLQEQLLADTQLDQILQDSVFLSLGSNASKKVPVKLNANIVFKSGYNYVNTVSLTPDSITVLGPQEQLDTLRFISTELLENQEVSEDINSEVALAKPENVRWTYSKDQIEVFARVDKFTEGKIKAPFKVVNLPKDAQVTTFPSEVEVVFQVGLSNYSKVTPETFEIICDYQESLNNKLDYLIPEVHRFPGLVSNIKVIPSKIEFLIAE